MNNELHHNYAFARLMHTDVSEKTVNEINALHVQLTGRDEVHLADVQVLERALSKDLRWIVARRDKIIVGMGYICLVPSPVQRKCWVHDVVTDRDHLKRGIAKEIMRRLFEQGWDYFKADSIDLTSKSKRVAANAMYQKLGGIRIETNHYRFFQQ